MPEAAPSAMEQIITAMATAFGSMATDVMGGFATIIPVVVPLFAALVGIGLILKVVRRITGR